jgi:hypothetical protein
MGYEQSIVGVNPGYPRLGSGAIEVAPSAAVAVDNPSGLSPAVGSGADCPDGNSEIAQQAVAQLPTLRRQLISQPGCQV